MNRPAGDRPAVTLALAGVFAVLSVAYSLYCCWLAHHRP